MQILFPLLQSLVPVNLSALNSYQYQLPDEVQALEKLIDDGLVDAGQLILDLVQLPLTGVVLGLLAAWRLLLDDITQLLVEVLARLEPVDGVGHALDGVDDHDVGLGDALEEVETAERDVAELHGPEVGQALDEDVEVAHVQEGLPVRLELEEGLTAFLGLRHVDTVHPLVLAQFLVIFEFFRHVDVLLHDEVHDVVELSLFEFFGVVFEFLDDVLDINPLFFW